MKCFWTVASASRGHPCTNDASTSHKPKNATKKARADT